MASSATLCCVTLSPTSLPLPPHSLLPRCVSGTRVVGPGKTQDVGGVTFNNYGSHHNAYPHVYFTAAAAVGGSEEEVGQFCVRLHKTLTEAAARESKRQGLGQGGQLAEGGRGKNCEQVAREEEEEGGGDGDGEQEGQEEEGGQ